MTWKYFCFLLKAFISWKPPSVWLTMTYFGSVRGKIIQKDKFWLLFPQMHFIKETKYNSHKKFCVKILPNTPGAPVPSHQLGCPLAHLLELNPKQGDQIHLRPEHPSSCQCSRLPTLVCSSLARLTFNQIRSNHHTYLSMLKVINIFRGRWLTLN